MGYFLDGDSKMTKPTEASMKATEENLEGNVEVKPGVRLYAYADWAVGDWIRACGVNVGLADIQLLKFLIFRSLKSVLADTAAEKAVVWPSEEEVKSYLNSGNVDVLSYDDVNSFEEGFNAAIRWLRSRMKAVPNEVVEALEFYANRDNWCGYHREVDTIPDDSEPAKADDGFDIQLGGKRARAALKALRGEE